MKNDITPPINSFTVFSDPKTEDNIKELYRGWLASELADGVEAVDRSNMFFMVERIIEAASLFKE